MKAARLSRCGTLLALLALLTPLAAWAQAGGLPALTSTPGAGGSQTYTLSIQTLLTLTALTFIPAALLMMTSFTRIIIVLSLLRHALGTQTSPPNQVLLGLALFLTFFIMSPVLDSVYSEAYQPLSENRITYQQAIERGAVPLRKFMLKQTRESDIALFARMANAPRFQSSDDIPMRLLVPAFVTSELKTAFQIGFIIFIPFLIVDMVVASVLMSMGMMMMSPVMIALPFKLMLFVLVDGWHLILGSLVASFAT
ncbi:MAG: Flagellar biosynthetic protein FliP precursor [Candidatus Accumulibacter regalis]|jgi:flagellar biosynthetic protein FliP|uniref:Flagellar biosynthetic protein FliP n=1 Tax=Accumulibacter regalis TaxID=522306 RepID=A0A011QJJ1_ACCRE|nr:MULTISPECIES: flagellar type III secretion system pore protein FliP [unclassified Candidatus Accumulibacter]EXI89522.1 MAG: Flagellar biosynthetic protein FliP precursor [Candidatus Accumulibacter regalis]MBL8368858.1 flagellar type III secretion system pore protein FliP [Accumulibacter sp.]MBN8512897.1 flagellar type III secretion system pore protein FliP [Accumulibacter sp.]MBO3702144.1 flagellar type III secretion system pore protein FliP [Accumulibacter sp.]HRE69955.1 flagellar type III